jgi:hypothetical protein
MLKLFLKLPLLIGFAERFTPSISPPPRDRHKGLPISDRFMSAINALEVAAARLK